MTAVLSEYQLEASNSHKQRAFEFYSQLLDVLKMNDRRYVPDWGTIADRWLNLIRPVWYERLKDPRKRPLLLRDIRSDLLGGKKLKFDDIFDQFSRLPSAAPADKRVVAVILGVSD